MPSYTNFFETMQEAQLRLMKTVVLYDGLPYFVICISDHFADGIFRIYLQPVGVDFDQLNDNIYPQLIHSYPGTHPSFAPMMDAWLTAHPNSPFLRKTMNSPSFNKFRPFPLGMCNVGNGCYYVERQPTRKSEQGLTNSMLNQTPIVTAFPGSGEGFRTKGGRNIELLSKPFKACVIADHPSAKECLDVLTSDKYENEAIAFNRNFAFAKGPVGMIFMAYKEDIVGYLPKKNFDYVVLGNNFGHCREAVRDLKLFNSIEG